MLQRKEEMVESTDKVVLWVALTFASRDEDFLLFEFCVLSNDMVAHQSPGDFL